MNLLKSHFTTFIFAFFLIHNSSGQDTLSTEDMIRDLYNVYITLGVKEGDYEICLKEKTEELCFSLIEKDSMNFVANNYLSLVYYNEAAKLSKVNNENDPRKKENLLIRRELLVKSSFYGRRAERGYEILLEGKRRQ
jgi:hypothetical protein